MMGALQYAEEREETNSAMRGRARKVSERTSREEEELYSRWS